MNHDLLPCDLSILSRCTQAHAAHHRLLFCCSLWISILALLCLPSFVILKCLLFYSCRLFISALDCTLYYLCSFFSFLPKLAFLWHLGCWNQTNSTNNKYESCLHWNSETKRTIIQYWFLFLRKSYLKSLTLKCKSKSDSIKVEIKVDKFQMPKTVPGTQVSNPLNACWLTISRSKSCKSWVCSCWWASSLI